MGLICCHSPASPSLSSLRELLFKYWPASALGELVTSQTVSLAWSWMSFKNNSLQNTVLKLMLILKCNVVLIISPACFLFAQLGQKFSFLSPKDNFKVMSLAFWRVCSIYFESVTKEWLGVFFLFERQLSIGLEKATLGILACQCPFKRYLFMSYAV